MVVEADELCECGHRRGKHRHAMLDRVCEIHGGLCTASGCHCQEFRLTDKVTPEEVETALGTTPVMCRNCGTRPATLTWVGDGGALALVHGGGVPWCKHCALVEQLKHARAMAAQIPDLENELAVNP